MPSNPSTNAMKPTLKRSGSGNNGGSTASRSRPGKPISKTVEMLRSNELLKRTGKGKEKVMLRGLNEVIQGMSTINAH